MILRLVSLLLIIAVQASFADTVGTTQGADAPAATWGLSNLKPFSLPVISVTRKDDGGLKGPYGRGTCDFKPGRYGDWLFAARDPKTGYEFVVDMPLPNGVLGKGKEFNCPERLVRDGYMSSVVIACKKNGNKIEVHVVRTSKGKYSSTEEATWNIDLNSNGDVAELKYRSTARGGRITDNFQCGEPPVS